jgi:hypothetical protein
MRLTRGAIVLVTTVLVTVVALAGPATAGESRSDKAILKAGVITKDDVPAGWTSKKATSSDRAYRGIAECRQIRSAVDNAKKRLPRAQSRDFEAPGSRGTTSAEDTVYVFKDVDAATDFLANYQAPDTSTCLQKGAAKATRSQAGAGEPTVSPITDLAGVGDDAVGYEITVDLSAGGETGTLYIDLVAVRVGRTFLGFNLANLSDRLPEGPALVQTVVARVAEAQASA